MLALLEPIPLRYWKALGPEVEKQLETILKLAPDMRVGRRTILDQFSTDALLRRSALK